MLLRQLSSKSISFLMVLHLLTRYLPQLNLGRIKLNLCFLFYCCFPCNLAKGKYIPLHITCLLAWLCVFLKDFLEHLEIDIFFELSSTVLCFCIQSLSYFFVISVMRRSGNRLICSTAPRTYPIQVTYGMDASSILMQLYLQLLLSSLRSKQL